MLAVYHAAFVCEALRSGVNTIPAGQAEAARSIGLTFGQSLREVLLPQAFRGAIAPLGSTLIALIKNTTVAAVILGTERGRRAARPDHRERGREPRDVLPLRPRLRHPHPAPRHRHHEPLAPPGGEAMSAAAVLFDAPGPRARLRHLILTVVGVLPRPGRSWVVYGKMESGQPARGLPCGSRSSPTPRCGRPTCCPGLWATLKAAAISIVLAGIYGLVFGMGRLSDTAPCAGLQRRRRRVLPVRAGAAHDGLLLLRLLRPRDAGCRTSTRRSRPSSSG